LGAQQRLRRAVGGETQAERAREQACGASGGKEARGAAQVRASGRGSRSDAAQERAQAALAPEQGAAKGGRLREQAAPGGGGSAGVERAAADAGAGSGRPEADVAQVDRTAAAGSGCEGQQAATPECARREQICARAERRSGAGGCGVARALGGWRSRADVAWPAQGWAARP
jgi:hypothetical protein